MGRAKRRYIRARQARSSRHSRRALTNHAPSACVAKSLSGSSSRAGTRQKAQAKAGKSRQKQTSAASRLPLQGIERKEHEASTSDVRRHRHKYSPRPQRLDLPERLAWSQHVRVFDAMIGSHPHTHTHAGPREVSVTFFSTSALGRAATAAAPTTSATPAADKKQGEGRGESFNSKLLS